jgi:hypothetical protein
VPFHYHGGVCFVAVLFVCRDQLTWNFRLPVLFYCFSGGSVVVTVEYFVYIMVCLLAGADVVSGGRNLRTFFNIKIVAYFTGNHLSP